MKNKLDTFVNFPIHDLNMSKYVKLTSRSDQLPMYELYAVINHYGGLGGGHYSAYAKVPAFLSLLNYVCICIYVCIVVCVFASFLNSAVTRS